MFPNEAAITPWWRKCCWSSTSIGSWEAAACSLPKAWLPSPNWRHSPPCRPPAPEKGTLKPQVVEVAAPPQGAAALIASRGPVPWAKCCTATNLFTTQPQSNQKLDKSIVSNHHEKIKRICPCGITSRHSTLFTIKIRVFGPRNLYHAKQRDLAVKKLNFRLIHFNCNRLPRLNFWVLAPSKA